MLNTGNNAVMCQGVVICCELFQHLHCILLWTLIAVLFVWRSLPACFSDTKAGCIKLRGKKERVEKMRRSVNVILEQQQKDETSIGHIRETRGCQAYLRHLATEETVRYPSYWKCVRKGTADTKRNVKRRELDAKSSTYTEIESLVQQTWAAKLVGQGRDAAGLNHSGIAVKKIWSVENPVLYRKYDAKKKEICFHASADRCPPVKGLLGESDILTHRHGT